MDRYKKIEIKGDKIVYYFIDNGKFFVTSEEIKDEKWLKMKSSESAIERRERTGLIHDSFSLNFMSARTCNMGCKYCFAGEGEYDDNPEKDKIMKASVYLKAFDWVLNVNKKFISNISLFGGEPMLGFAEFKSAIEQLEKICELKKCPMPQISISTNAVLFDNDIFRFIKKYKVKVGLSVDGPEYINDLGRIAKRSSSNKISAYNCVANAARKLREEGMFYTIQCTLNAEHIRAYTPGIIRKWIIDMGDLAKCDMVYVPVTTDHTDLKIIDYKKLVNIAKELVDFYIEELLKDESQYSSSLVNGTFLGLIYKMYFPSCKGGDGFYLVDTDGDLFPCHIFCNNTGYKIGSIYSNEGVNQELERGFLQHNKSHCNECQDCIAKNVCKVWCNGLQQLYNGTEDEPLTERCIFQKAIVEHGIRRIVELKLYEKKKYEILIRHMIEKNNEYIMRKMDGTKARVG